MTTTEHAVQQISVGQILSKSTSIFTSNILPFMLISLLIAVPGYLIEFLSLRSEAPGAVTAAGTFINIMLQALVTGAVVYSVFRQLQGQALDAGSSFGLASKRLGALFGLSILAGLGIVLAGLLFLIPGLIVACMWYVAIPVMMVEGFGVSASMSRSSALTKGSRWQIFGMLVLVLILTFVIGFALGFVAYFVGGRPAGLVMQHAASGIVQVFGAIVSSVCYFELRVRREGISLDQIADVFA